MIECFAMMVQLNDALKINTLLSHWLRMDGNIFKQFIKQSASYFNSIMCIIVPIQKAVQNALCFVIVIKARFVWLFDVCNGFIKHHDKKLQITIFKHNRVIL